ncbi:MAG TPA: hypothetical protein VE269_06050 [Gaiellaceae bacterium]|nr:hypothetical protein [Gaiellaceae bacterium]
MRGAIFAAAVAVVALVAAIDRIDHDTVGAAVLFLCVPMVAGPQIAYALAKRTRSVRWITAALALRAMPFVAIIVLTVVVAVEDGDAAWFLPLVFGALVVGTLFALVSVGRRRRER